MNCQSLTSNCTVFRQINAPGAKAQYERLTTFIRQNTVFNKSIFWTYLRTGFSQKSLNIYISQFMDELIKINANPIRVYKSYFLDNESLTSFMQ